MKVYSFYTPSHVQLKNNWFLPTIQDDFEVIFKEHSQESETAEYMKPGWIETMQHKADLVIRAINENPNEVFVYADVDIQFFKPIKFLINDAIRDKDMVFQQNSLQGRICAGFFAARASEKVLRIWEKIQNLLDSQNKMSDQEILNQLIFGDVDVVLKNSDGSKPEIPANEFGIRWDYLPETFYNPGKYWVPGNKLKIPPGIVMHHANWTCGVRNKIDQFKYVRALALRNIPD